MRVLVIFAYELEFLGIKWTDASVHLIEYHCNLQLTRVSRFASLPERNQAESFKDLEGWLRRHDDGADFRACLTVEI